MEDTSSIIVTDESLMQQKRILVAEDFKLNLILIQAFLNASCWRLTIAKNGLEAVEFYQKQSFDLILMDMLMPVMDGYQATRAIREMEIRENRPKTPIIALTAHTFSEEIKECLANGCDGYLAKPFTKKGLLTKINSFWM
jgi:CheY-like chemotaxis protein